MLSQPQPALPLNDVHVDVWSLRSEEFLAGLSRKRRIVEGQDNIAYGDLAHSLMLLEQRRKIVFLNVSRPVPWSKESVFSEVPVANGVSNFPDGGDGRCILASPAGFHHSARRTADIPVVGQVDLGAETQELPVKNDCTTVIPAAPVHDGQTHINDDVVERGVR